MLWRHAALATMDGGGWGLIEDGALPTRGATVLWTGPDAALPAGCDAARVHDLGGALVTPGLVDCHTHLVYGGERAAEFAQRLQRASCEEIARVVAAALFAQADGRIVAVQDHSGTRHSSRGLDPAALSGTEGVCSGKGGELIDAEHFWNVDCDIVVPAALEGQLTADRARRTTAKLVLEGANGPTLPAADDVLTDRGILVVPDVICNAGGVTVSYFDGSRTSRTTSGPKTKSTCALTRSWSTHFVRFGTPPSATRFHCAQQRTRWRVSGSCSLVRSAGCAPD